MDCRIKEMIEQTKTAFGLEHYYLKSYTINRDVNHFQEMIYTLSMEWFPEGVEAIEEDVNPPGTAVIELNIHTHEYVSAIFVMEKTYAEHGIQFSGDMKASVIQWVERETGLTYNDHFQLLKEAGNAYAFACVYEGVKLSPLMMIEVKHDEQGRLTFFSANYSADAFKKVKKEAYTLTLSRVEHLVKEQVKLIHMPLFEEERIIPMYAAEEIYVTNETLSKVPINFLDRPYVSMKEKMTYEQIEHNEFMRQPLDFTETLTVDQAFSLESSREILPIILTEQEKCQVAVKNCLQKEYPNESGQWLLKTLHRDKDYIIATLRLINEEEPLIWKRKLTVIIDGKTYEPINIVDNQMMLETFASFAKPKPVTINEEAAYNKLYSRLIFEPVYVYDFTKEQYILCGKIDCHYSVHAQTGEVMSLDD
ncbi:MAG TPA: hypothetical protein VK125_03000 [Bacillota bacterium]|nr:hypothetical protein [Bacillota bacterium]